MGKLYYYYTPTKEDPPGTPNRPVTVPWIQMRGRWLDAAGFAIGAKVKMRVRPGRLVLTVVKGESKSPAGRGWRGFLRSWMSFWIL